MNIAAIGQTVAMKMSTALHVMVISIKGYLLMDIQ